MSNLTFLGSLEVSHYYYPGWLGVVWLGVVVEIIKIKAALSFAGLVQWTGTELGKI